jgi:hypothetical protein
MTNSIPLSTETVRSVVKLLWATDVGRTALLVGQDIALAELEDAPVRTENDILQESQMKRKDRADGESLDD